MYLWLASPTVMPQLVAEKPRTALRTSTSVDHVEAAAPAAVNTGTATEGPLGEGLQRYQTTL
ncbi:hypothetical protein PC129_g7208 [Phytophthora cactorum]|uniref:Uncharacterized protein n=1 Tax=Phytophthora cactorum TaxID=29920 RepID=A0A8T1IEA3_9STRA|nr:hypothetical protein PC114_g10036 [Phytophthora cactorum]KAG2942268.1 hypothetical protein PC117_g9836 [Phytophthora cactorum]KAG3016154.1 hypothetical protein PC120_g11799 [Phytophthora cactorum]KAG3021660.1 hypothetical protein PC119_g9540 [Phytophthora cactorum]KAG3172151.1 hypothetical protein C6341_g10295 [Phytophthora cactorum]